MKTKITRSIKEISKNSGTIKFAEITAGEALAILNSLKERSKISSVAKDCYDFLLTEMKENWHNVYLNHVEQKD